MTGVAPKPGTSDIELCSGKYLDLLNPDPSMITIEVVAHHLSQVARYAGAARRIVSVAEHAVLVAAYIMKNYNDPRRALSGLHHDDGEAFLGDVTRPLKERIGRLYNPIEQKMLGAVYEALRLENLGARMDDPAIKEADEWALAAEAYHFMPTQGREWWCWGKYDPDNKEDKNPSLVYSQIFLHMEPPRRMVMQAWIRTHDNLVVDIRNLEREKKDNA